MTVSEGGNQVKLSSFTAKSGRDGRWMDGMQVAFGIC